MELSSPTFPAAWARAASRQLAHALLDAALAGVALGAADLAVIAARGGLGAPSALAAIALSLVIALVAGTPTLLMLRLVGRHPGVRLVATAVRAPGAERVATLVRLAVWLIALAAFWGAAYVIVAFASATYRHAGAAALLSATAIAGAGLVILLIASWLAPAAGRASSHSRALDRLTRGRVALALALFSAAVLAALANVLVQVIAPQWDPAPAYVYAVGGALLVAAAMAGIARRLSARRALLLGAACALVTLAGLVAVGQAPRARGAIMAHGAPSRASLRLLHRLTDGDGDGFSDRLGGGDCDDGDRRVHPRAPERPGNRRDDNCVAGDLAASALAHRQAPRPSRDPRAPRHDILLLTIDAVRADHTSAYGYRRPTTPRLEQLAGRATRFERAESSSSVTRWALPALLFGRHPTSMSVRVERGIRRPDPRGLPTLASTLAAAGYETRAILGLRGMVTDGNVAGFAEVEHLATPVAHLPHPDNAAEVSERAIRWLRARSGKKPAFLWIHYIDPHGTYQRPPGAPDFGPSDVDRYDSEIAHVDAQIGRLLDAVAQGGGDRRTIVVVAADHGEAFGDHGTITHGKSLYEEQTHVPLVVAIPGGQPRTAAGPVGLVDLAPTLLDLVGVDTPPGMSGISLAAVIRDGAPVPDHPVLSELVRDARVPRDLLALHTPGWKLIRDLEVDTVELYDLAADPGELEDRSDEPLAAELRERLDRLADTELSPLQSPQAPR